MKIRVLLFARLKEIVGREVVELHRQEMFTVGDAWDALRSQFPQVEGFGRSLLFSVNQEYAELDTPIKEGDELAVFPPVSGGEILTKKMYPENETGDVYQIVQEPIPLEEFSRQLSQPEDGAIVTFSGIVRNNTGGRKTLYLEYEAYIPMAIKKIQEIGTTIKQQWKIGRIGIIHRLGRLEIGEASVVIVVTSAHRHIAFEACHYAIDSLKKVVPIWKKEFFEDGEVWVEGECPPAASNPSGGCN